MYQVVCPRKAMIWENKKISWQRGTGVLLSMTRR